MLVLTRKRGEQITVGDDIVLTVVSVDGGRIRLGIEAPRSVPILREEIAAGRKGPLRNPVEVALS